MLTLTNAQYQTFLARDTQNFVAAVADQFLAKRPEMLTDPGRTEIIARMQTAYDTAQQLGFTSTPHMVYMMYIEADGPGMFADEMIRHYLTRPGATPEQRLDDFDALLREHARRLKGEQ
ncbi:hypothetical protein [Herbaspirillum robiniae]|uniref:hypothetical protein n=1 Tax=Herbaspirillum robiniae TaxID=2014887 RepID=UPI003D784A54